MFAVIISTFARRFKRHRGAAAAVLQNNDAMISVARAVIATVHISLWYCCVERKKSTIRCVKYWATIAEKLRQAGFSWGCSSEIDSAGRVIFTADAYSRDGRRFTVLADERLTAFLELDAAIHRQLELG